MKTYGLEKFAERLDDLVDMTAVTEFPSLEMLLPWRSGLMRLVSGRVLTEEDAGRKVCMLPSAMLSTIGKRVGDTVLLAVSDHDLAGYASGIPGMGDEYDPEDFKDAEEYVVVGTYSNDSKAYYYDNPKAVFLEDILIPCSSALTPEDGMIRMDRFSFTVHKDDYDAFCAETQPLLKEAGYSVTMVTPEYAEIEEKIAEFREKSGSTFLKAGIALAAGLAVAAGSLVLFWSGEYLEERRLGAWRREAGGLYLRSFTVAAALSAASSVLIALLLGITRLAPFLSPEKLSASVWGIMTLFSASELFIYGVLVFTVVLWMDRRKFGSGVPKNGHTASFASMSRKAGRRGQNLLPLFRRRTAWILFASVILLLLLSVAWLDKTVSESRAEMERTIGEMSVRFQLSGGRKSGTGAAFSIEMSKLRQLLHMEYFEKFGGASLSLTVVAGEQPENISEREYLQILWTPDPEAAGIRAVEGELGDGLWLPAELAEKYRVSAGDELKVYRTGMGNFGKAEYLLHVAAITDGTKTYASEKCFDELFEFVNFDRDIHIGNRQLHISSSVMVGGVSFHLKKEYNTRLSEIERELQALLNTPHPDDRNRDVTVSYNSAEIDGMLEPLERTISSAEFFGRLFRAALPAVAYLIAILTILSFRNEIGVRRFLGEKSSSVFFEIWFPVLALFLPGYLLSALILLCSPLLPYAPWDLSLWHFLGTALFAAAALGILCALRPYDLLKEKEYE
ncbi:MAG: hypothetical protein IKX85_02985 [Clostridia bacterium]|nr:hypothetical protein [Clostridia bacterium]